MQIIDQHTKAIMEECKARARKAGLSFEQETLEYIVTNRDLLELSPKVMIPTLYDYWVNDVEVLKGIGRYKLYPNNPYETVINSRPAISFYNDNNPDWLNIMIFYHVIAHIDFFQNNSMFAKTWNDDFVGQALADKRLIAALREKHGRWVDYSIEFSRNMDNLCGYYPLIGLQDLRDNMAPDDKLSYFFDTFLPNEAKVPEHVIFKEIEKYNSLLKENKELAETNFFGEVRNNYPEFQAKFEKNLTKKIIPEMDIMEFVMANSKFLNKEKNEWIKQVMSIIRNTSIYLAPQIRTKIINEGWASYWHDRLFIEDERLAGHEAAYALANANVTSLSRVGLNPYAIGLRLIRYAEELASKGMMKWYYQKRKHLLNINIDDDNFEENSRSVFLLRKHFNDYSLINTFVDQEFVNRHNLFVAGQRFNQRRGTIEYYVKSRKAEDYKQMLIDELYHPPKITVDKELTTEDNLYLIHSFEGKQLIKKFIPDTMMGISYLWGGEVQLETTEIVASRDSESKRVHRKVLYTYSKERKLEKKNL